MFFSFIPSRTAACNIVNTGVAQTQEMVATEVLNYLIRCLLCCVFFILCTQTPPVGKRSKKANSKILSPMPSATAVPVEAGKSGDEVSLQYVIPHLVLNVTSKDYPSATEMLKGSVLPPLDDVWLPGFYGFVACIIYWCHSKNLLITS